MNTQFKKGALELCVLSQLRNADKYGYELTETISQEMELATGTLYLILKRLKDEEYVETYSVESEGRRPESIITSPRRAWNISRRCVGNGKNLRRRWTA